MTEDVRIVHNHVPHLDISDRRIVIRINISIP
jgi:hypothetical protein